MMRPQASCSQVLVAPSVSLPSPSVLRFSLHQAALSSPIAAFATTAIPVHVGLQLSMVRKPCSGIARVGLVLGVCIMFCDENETATFVGP